MIIKGIVIKIVELEEKGRILYILTESGVINVTAHGAKKPTSKNNPATDYFSYGDFSITENRGRYYLESSCPIRIFHALAADIEKLSLAAYFAEVLFYSGTARNASKQKLSEHTKQVDFTFAVPAGTDCEDELKTMLISLQNLEKNTRENAFIKAVFEMRIASAIGFLPDLIGCAECYKYQGEIYFDIASGTLFCKEHNESGVKISDSLLDTIRFVCLSPVEKIMNFKIGEKTQKEFSKLAENYLIYHMENKPKTLLFYKKLL
jgi:DNA repair protein RecO (recombination protein O)